METATLLLIAIALAMDAFTVSVAYGLSFTSRRHGSALAISTTFGAFQAGMPVLGWFCGRLLVDFIAPLDHWIAFALLGYIGGKMIWDALHQAEPEAVSTHPATLLALGLATSIDALAVGLLFAVLSEPVLVPVLTIGGVTWVISYAGVVAGHELRRLFRTRGRRAVQLVGGLVLVGIGLKIVVDHLSATPPS